MAIRDALLPEYDHEMKTTRKLLERVPMTQAQWKPHDKSMSLGQLATHIAEIPAWVSSIMNTTCLDMGENADHQQPTYHTSEELVSAFDANITKARDLINTKTDAELMEVWTLKKGKQVLLSLPKAAVLRSFLMNHLIHHRGQLSVYIRLRDVPVPSIYGPSADDPGM
jgi:uncharacterized damage-inducible protein DinB